MAEADDILVYAHLGDLHLTTETQDNYRDLAAIVAEISGFADAIDFVYVPGDNADNGLPDQYALVARQLARLPVPVHIVTGDHDMEQGGLANFYRWLGAERLPKIVDAGGVRCLFLDICGPGSGGPDFRLGSEQIAWLRHELDAAASAGRCCAIFMHTYPADLKGQGETAAINAAFEARDVLLVDMGHTHYNELANDGRTIFATTRSTGQIEEGPVGYSLATIDRRTVSWRFRAVGTEGPIVLITAPADHRLATDGANPDHVPRGRAMVRASVLGPRSVKRVTCRVGNGRAVAMIARGANRYVVDVVLDPGEQAIRVEAEDASGRIGVETIEVATHAHLDTRRHADGSDADAVEPWPERGILGTQLGPNRNGREW